MRTLRGSLGILLLALFVAPAWCADVTGQWKGEWMDYQARTSTQNTFTFKQDGSNLTGTITTQSGEMQIRDGKVSEDSVSFTAVQKIGKREATLTYKGRISGNEIKFKVNFPGADQFWIVTAKKAP
jgi:hypothetical protein